MSKQQIINQIDEAFDIINTYLNQKPIRKTLENDIMKELKKLKTIMNVNKQKLSDQYKKNIQIKEKKVKQQMEKLKPMVFLTSQERNQYREEICNVVKSIEKKISTLYEKKDNKKRQMSIEFFKCHQAKLTTFTQWLLSPSRQFNLDHIKILMKYLNDILISHEDIIYQEEIQQIYDKILFVAQEPHQVSFQMFQNSYENRPTINDYLLSKQTKQIVCRNSICPHFKMIDLSNLSKMSKDTLFFMFYFHKGQTQQYLAAKQLMKHHWRYYKKFNIWLKRGSQPTFDGNDFQTGNYVCVGTDLIRRQRKGIKVYHKYLLQQL